MHYEVRTLPQSLDGPAIKRCAYLLRRRHGALDLHINEVDGRTVSLRGDDAAATAQGWADLLRLIDQERGQNPAASSPRPVPRPSARVLFQAGGRPTWEVSRLLDHPDVHRLPGGQLALTGHLAGLQTRLRELFDALAQAERAIPFYAEPYWTAEDLPGYGYQKIPDGLVGLGHQLAPQPSPAAAAGPRRFFQNAACNQVWKHLEGREIAQALVYDTTATCCRDEGSQHFLLEYLLAFTMRELAMVGSPAHCLEFRERAIRFCTGLVAELELEATLETANDPFFLGGREPAIVANLVLPEIVKYELRLHLRDGKSLACASFNVHGGFFAERLRYRGPESWWTACTAFGLERFLWAILCQHGPEATAWPPRLRRLVGLAP